MKCLAWPGVAALVLFAVASHSAYAQQGVITPPSVTQTHVDVTVQAPPPDPQAVAEASVQSSNSVIVNVIGPVPVHWLDQIDHLPNIWSQTPPELTYRNGDLASLAGMIHNAALALTVLALFFAGAKYALGQGASFGRLVFGMCLCVGNLVWWQWGIDANNTFCSAINAPSLAELIRPNLNLPDLGTAATPNSETVANVVLIAVYAVVGLLTMFSLIFRLAFICVLIAIGPLALITYTSEEASSWGAMYARMSIGMLFSQVLIVLGFRVAGIVGGIAGGGIVGTLVGIAVLLLIRELPTLMSSGRMNHGPNNGAAFGVIVAIGRRFAGAIL